MKDFVEKLKDEFTSLAVDGQGSAEFTGYVDTGCYILNALLSGSIYGGLPNNKITAIAGESSTGKSFLALGTVRNFLDSDPSAMVVYYDTEAAITKDMMEDRGIDVKRVIISEPATIQQFRTHCIKVLDSYTAMKPKDRAPLLIVLDSLGMLSTSKEVEDSTEGKETKDMTRAAIIKAAFRVITLKTAKARVPIIILNHTYQTMGLFPTTEMGGGSGLKYSASSICMLAKSKDKDGTEIVGNIIRAKMYKSRLSKENAEARMKLSYKSGLDRYYGLLELAEKHGIIKKVSTRYEIPRPDGSVLKVFGKQINENPEEYYTEELLQQIEIAANKEYRYGADSSDGIDEAIRTNQEGDEESD